MQATSGDPAKTRVSIKETITSVVIAFALAFVFRGFVIEAFLIPTGSMAPTLRGAHIQYMSPQSGYAWATGPRDTVGAARDPVSVQGTRTPLEYQDPMTGAMLRSDRKQLSWGDRIFVMKYLYSVYDPKRYDVVVFKNPSDPTINYIKRLIGLPGDEIALVDGDVFVRTPEPGEAHDAHSWTKPGWRAAAKPELAQRAMWQPVFDSAYTPLKPATIGRAGFVAPWLGVGTGESGKDWDLTTTPGAYVYKGTGATKLAWNPNVWAIDDENPYNAYSDDARAKSGYPVSDIRMSLGVRPASAATVVTPQISARAHRFQAVVDLGARTYTLRMQSRPVDATRPDGPWRDLASGAIPSSIALRDVTNIDFWHVDQTLQLWINDQFVAKGSYDWSPELRIQNTLGMTFDDVMQRPGDLRVVANYQRPEVEWQFSGGPVTLYRVRLDRDIFFQPDIYSGYTMFGQPGRRGEPALATHPAQPLFLGPDQFFVCGDNSAASLDARLWEFTHPWAAEVEPTLGVVHRDLLIGKAFFVYLPSPTRTWGIPVPDAGKMRWIW